VRVVIIGTAGHIDHGKTALVRALTGIDADRLKEEKARGITIDLGFAYMPTPDGVLGFIDVPGHEKFVHNMLAGATGIDFVLLVVAADDGVMPQTLEHLAIVDLLGIKQGVVALSKADLVTSARREEATEEIAEALAATSLAACDIIPVSSVTAEGVDVLRGPAAMVAVASPLIAVSCCRVLAPLSPARCSQAPLWLVTNSSLARVDSPLACARSTRKTERRNAAKRGSVVRSTSSAMM
jgi:small GTP-binding protein